jgi:hypothetical protein
MADPPKEIKRKPKDEEEESKRFRLTYKRKTTPCTSIATNIKNLKASYPSVFSR